MKLILQALFLLFFFSLNAQKNVKLINSMELLQEGVQYYDDEEYEKALKSFDKITKNDTNYLLTQYERALTYNAMDEKEKCVEICNEFLSNKNNIGDKYEYSIYNLLGTALDGLGKTEESIAAYDRGIKAYPKYTSYKLNKAVTYNTAEQYDKAVAMLKEVLDDNPYYANAHIQLGLLAANEDKNTQALMSFVMSTIFARSVNKLEYTNTYSAGNIETESKGIKLNTNDDLDDFEDLDLIIRNKIALDSKYKTGSKFNLAFVKQLHALVENIEYDEDDKGYWMQNYVPYFVSVKEDNQFENMIYFLIGISTSESLQKQVAKKIPEMQEFYAWHSEKWNELHGVRELTANGVKGQYKRWYYEQKLQAYGNKNDDGESIGNWLFFQENGKVMSYGSYNDKGERHGDWTFFNTNGTMSAEYTYKDGEMDSKYKDYDNYGYLEGDGFYKDGEKDGIIRSFYKDGTVDRELVYKAGKIVEPSKEYFTSGELSYEISYNEDFEIEGDVFSYYPNGTKRTETKWKAGERDGPNNFYYINGQLEAKYNYKDGLFDGPYEKYYITGQLKEKGTYLNGKTVGEDISYHLNGEIDDKIFFDENGKKNGIIEGYSPNGFKIREIDYSKGNIVGYRQYDKDGNIIDEATKKKNKLNYVYAYDNGQAKSVGLINNGLSEGLWKFYAKNGVLVSEQEYENDIANGFDKNYNINGNLSSEFYYIDGELDGYYKSFYLDKTLKSEGNYKDDLTQGTWYYYYENGEIKSINHYLNDEFEGYQVDFDLNGNKSEEFYYEDGILIEVYDYDTSGNVLDTISFNNGTATVKYKTQFNDVSREGSFKNGNPSGLHKFYNGKNVISAEGNYLNGSKDGEWKWYVHGKLETKGTYVNNEVDGEYEHFYADGTLKTKYTYNNGIDTGVWNYYHDNGKLNRTVDHENGERHGESFYYSPEGDLQYVKYHDNGYLIGYSYNDENGKLKEMIPVEKETVDIVAYFPNGKKSAEIGIKYDWHEGDCKRYYANGQLESSIDHKDGNSHGEYNFYYADGTLKEKGNYFYDDFHGKRTLYFSNGKVKQEESFKYGVLFGPTTFYNEAGKKVKNINYYNDNIIDETTF